MDQADADESVEYGKKDALLYVTIGLVLLSVILTGWNLYGKITKFGGAGGLVPITGFANSVASPAIEYQKEGQVFGIGVKIFTIAGPVILYGIFLLLQRELFIWRQNNGGGLDENDERKTEY